MIEGLKVRRSLHNAGGCMNTSSVRDHEFRKSAQDSSLDWARSRPAGPSAPRNGHGKPSAPRLLEVDAPDGRRCSASGVQSAIVSTGHRATRDLSPL